MAGAHNRVSEISTDATTSVILPSPRSTSYMDGVPTEWSTPSAVLALPCGSRSMTRTRNPCIAMAAAILTADVVFPTPPFWFATVITRVSGGLGQRSRWIFMTFTACNASRAMGVSSTVSRETSALDVSRETPPAVPTLRCDWLIVSLGALSFVSAHAESRQPLPASRAHRGRTSRLTPHPPGDR